MRVFRWITAALALGAATYCLTAAPNPDLQPFDLAAAPIPDDASVSANSSILHPGSGTVRASNESFLESGGSLSTDRPVGTLELGFASPLPTPEFQSALRSPEERIPSRLASGAAAERSQMDLSAAVASHHEPSISRIQRKH